MRYLDKSFRDDPEWVKLDLAHTEHIRACDTCNYDKPCMECEIGDPEETAENPRDAYDIWESHNCNCSLGKGRGAFLRRQIEELEKRLWDDLPRNRMARYEFAESRRSKVYDLLMDAIIKAMDVPVVEVPAYLRGHVGALEHLYRRNPISPLGEGKPAGGLTEEQKYFVDNLRSAMGDVAQVAIKITNFPVGTEIPERDCPQCPHNQRGPHLWTDADGVSDPGIFVCARHSLERASKADVPPFESATKENPPVNPPLSEELPSIKFQPGGLDFDGIAKEPRPFA